MSKFVVNKFYMPACLILEKNVNIVCQEVGCTRNDVFLSPGKIEF